MPANHYHQVAPSSQFNSRLLPLLRLLAKCIDYTYFMDSRENSLYDIITELNEPGLTLRGLRDDAQPRRQFQIGYFGTFQRGHSIISCPAEQAFDFWMSSFAENNDAEASISQLFGGFLGTADYRTGSVNYLKLSSLNL
jgi:hypothetical protein